MSEPTSRRAQIRALQAAGYTRMDAKRAIAGELPLEWRRPRNAAGVVDPTAESAARRLDLANAAESIRQNYVRRLSA